MIKLVVISQNHVMTTHSFDLPSVIVGAENSSQVHLKLPGETLLPRHIQIIKQDNRYFVHNLANDPFVTLNDHPFGKQPIKNGDRIQIGETIIRFEIVNETATDRNQNQKVSFFETNHLPCDIEDLVKQVESLAAAKDTSLKKPIKNKEEQSVESIEIPEPNKLSEENQKSSSHDSPSKLSLKDYYLSEYDDDHITHPIHEISNTHGFDHESSKKRYKLIKYPLIALGIAIIIMGAVYLWVINQSGEEETMASRSIADIAMALTHAQIQNIHPQNQNWSDPEFIKNNLIAVLGNEFSSLAELDSHGQLTVCPYMLRIYTSSDLSQFLVIAQPEPSLLHWIIPKATIIVDSRAMEMRKIQDLKTLNRLLVNASTLDGTNAEEISNLVHHGELITLNSLAPKKENYGFSPPKALAMLHPEGANLIYNAPRYYSLGENLIKRSLELIAKPVDNHELTLFLQDLSALSKYPHLVLYSSEGLEHAMQSQKALATLAPEHKFLFAYLQLNSKGIIAGTHLLMDETNDIAAIKLPHENSIERNIYNALNEKKVNESKRGIQNQSVSQSNQDLPDSKNPIFLHLSTLATFRQQALKPIYEEFIDVLQKETQTPQHDFEERFNQLKKRYDLVNDEQKSKIIKYIDIITPANQEMPAADFVKFMQNAGLKELFDMYLRNIKNNPSLTQAPQLQIDTIVKQIDGCINWNNLEKQVTQANKLLQFNNIKDAQSLISFQNTLRSRVIEKLNQFILSEDHCLPPSSFTPETRIILLTILKSAWINDSDTQEFYLAEFDLRAKADP